MALKEARNGQALELAFILILIRILRFASQCTCANPAKRLWAIAIFRQIGKEA
jgi:hypothetical protein